MDQDGLVSKLKEKFPESILDVSSFRGEITLHLRSGDILPVCRFLRDDPELSFDYLTDLCGVDNYPQEPRFLVVYHLCAMKSRSRLRLKVSLPDGAPRIASVVSVWKAANWLEREAFDMFGTCGESSSRPIGKGIQCVKTIHLGVKPNPPGAGE
jgi:NADH-quinone oxidoreductase subunit C